MTQLEQLQQSHKNLVALYQQAPTDGLKALYKANAKRVYSKMLDIRLQLWRNQCTAC